MPVLEARFYERNKKLVGERTWWDTDNFKVGANTLAKKNDPPSIARHFPCIRDFINPDTGALYSAPDLAETLSKDSLSTWNRVAASITSYLTSNSMTWYGIDAPRTPCPHGTG